MDRNMECRIIQDEKYPYSINWIRDSIQYEKGNSDIAHK